MIERWLGFILVAAVLGSMTARAEGQTLTLYVQFLYGTNEEKPADPGWKPVGPKLSKHLAPVFRWKHYWEVGRHQVGATRGKVSKVNLNNTRNLEIELIDDKRIEFRLYRQGELTRKSRQQINFTGMEILGGSRVDDNAWFVVIRGDKPRS